MQYVKIVFEMLGSLGLFLFGMKIMSESIQRAAGERLKQVMNFMTGNRFSAVLTGLLVTGIIQSSSATTVIVVSFVNAGLLSLVQATGVIMGANIGTTITAWIVSLIGFSIKIAVLAIPCIGIGFAMSVYKRLGQTVQSWGEALLGFGLLFLGLDFLTKTIPNPNPEMLSFLARFSDMGVLSTLICVTAGMVLTMLIHSSSASTAIAITLAFQGILDFPMAAGIILGCNIGTTIDAFLASIGTKVNARRAAWVHILFNVFGSVWAVILFRPFLGLVDLLVPGHPPANIATHLAMLHTVFNTINTIIIFPFVPQYAALVSKLIRPRKGEGKEIGLLRYVAAPLRETPELNLLAARKEISDMADLTTQMFATFRENLRKKPVDIDADVKDLKEKETYADQMLEELSRFLAKCEEQKLNDNTRTSISVLMKTVSELENMTDTTYTLILLLQRSVKKKMHLDKKAIEDLAPYTQLVENFLEFIRMHLGRRLTAEQLEEAFQMEEEIDQFKANLNKMARKRIEAGADVRSELLYIDIVRQIEKMGDYAFSIAESLKLLRHTA